MVLIKPYRRTQNAPKAPCGATRSRRCRRIQPPSGRGRSRLRDFARPPIPSHGRRSQHPLPKRQRSPHIHWLPCGNLRCRLPCHLVSSTTPHPGLLSLGNDVASLLWGRSRSHRACHTRAVNGGYCSEGNTKQQRLQGAVEGPSSRCDRVQRRRIASSRATACARCRRGSLSSTRRRTVSKIERRRRRLVRTFAFLEANSWYSRRR
jgi:hypothetical protein